MSDSGKENVGLGGIYDWIIACLIIVSVISFSIETLPSLGSETRTLLFWIETFIISIFVVEYIYRVVQATKKWSFIFSFYGLVDLIAILPYFLMPALDLRSLRLMRFLRFLRLLKLARYNKAVWRFGKALQTAKEEIVISLVGTFVLIFLAAVGIYFFEHEAQPEVFASIFDSLWWSVATFTTVGYGDVYPITVGGKIFTMLILFIGLGLVAATTGIISSALLAVRKLEDEN